MGKHTRGHARPVHGRPPLSSPPAWPQRERHEVPRFPVVRDILVAGGTGGVRFSAAKPCFGSGRSRRGGVPPTVECPAVDFKAKAPGCTPGSAWPRRVSFSRADAV